jgi:AraC-like DNA-binding protein
MLQPITLDTVTLCRQHDLPFSVMSKQIPAELVRRQIQTLQCAGHPTAALRVLDLGETFFSEQALNDNERVSMDLAGQVFQRCKAIVRDTSFGFSNGPGEPQQQALLLFLGTLDCPTLGTMLKKQGELVAYMQRHNEFALSLVGSGEQTLAGAGFSRTSNPSTIPQHYLLANDVMHLFWWYQTYCWLINQQIPLHSVQLMGQADAWRGVENALPELFACPVQFEQAHFAIRFNTDWLEKPLSRNGSEVEAFFKEMGSACSTIPVKRDSVASVRQLLAASSDSHSLTLQQAADQLHMSRETLIRHLKAQETSFQQLKDVQRSKTAHELLQSTEMSLADIADSLGFANGPAFTRAFKRWHGQTPSNVRQHLRDSPATCKD